MENTIPCFIFVVLTKDKSMKFKLKYANPQDGDRRIKKRFALFPIIIGDEGRWLERVKIVQKYDNNYAEGGWKNWAFVNE